MSAQTVRQQLQTFLTAPPITGLETVYLSMPWWADGGDWNLSANNGWGAIGWPWISDESEERITLSAQTPTAAAVGQKQVTYKVSIVLLFQYLIPSDAASADGWQTPLDELIEAVKTRLRSDPKAGTGPGLAGVIFQQSQDNGDLAVMRDTPKRLPGKVVVWQRIDTTVHEIITA